VYIVSVIVLGKTTESIHCAVTGPCLRMRHRPSARRLYWFGRFITYYRTSVTDNSNDN